MKGCSALKTECFRTDSPLPRDAANVLVVMLDHHLGNVVVSLPVIDVLLTYFGRRPTVVVDDRYVPLVRMLPSAGTVMGYPQQSRKRRGLIQNLEPLAFTAKAAAARYRTVIDLTRSKRAALFTLFTLARRRIGFAACDCRWVYSDRIDQSGAVHAMEEYARILACIGRSEVPGPVRLTAPPSARDQVAETLKRGRPHPDVPFAVMHPGAGKVTRLWPAERFAAVADAIVRRHQMDICIIGTPAEKALLDRVYESMTERNSAFFLTLNLEQLVALFERAALIFSNESGPTHLAAATDLPIVTIFGPTQEAVWRPLRTENTTLLRGADCEQRCARQTCYAERRCLMALEPDAVIRAIDATLARCTASKTETTPR